MLPSGQISHAIPGRIRARILERRGDERFFARVREELEREPGIARLDTNALTGSVLVLHNLDAERIASLAESHGLFRLEHRSADEFEGNGASTATLFGSFARSQPSSLYERLALALIGFAAFEAMQGNIAAPAVTLLWYAFRLLEERPGANGAAVHRERRAD
jgi:hypothetical protein